MGSPTVIETPTAMRQWSQARHGAATIALVPTMGALHDGHVSLIEAAQEHADVVVVSIFVNPLQFGEAHDFDAYPRPLDDDLATCGRQGVAAVYAPSAATMYPPGFDTCVRAGRLAETMEGASRPGHFDGVVTVVTKLFGAVSPTVAVFGEKDFQQLAIVRRLVADLDLGVKIVACPTSRESDGLARSSRNRRLDDEQRRAATCLPRALEAAASRAADPTATVNDVRESARAVIEAEPLADLDYVEVFDPDTLAQITEFIAAQRHPGHCRIALAARVGQVRLIDNDDLFGR